LLMSLHMHWTSPLLQLELARAVERQSVAQLGMVASCAQTKAEKDRRRRRKRIVSTRD
jgi:hypothetical protein